MDEYNLTESIKKGNYKEVEYLINELKDNKELRDSALLNPAESTLLIPSNKSRSSLIPFTDQIMNHAFYIAIKYKQIDIIRFLIKIKEELSFEDTNSVIDEIFYDCACNGEIDNIKYLISQEFKFTKNAMSSSLITACVWGHLNIVEYLNEMHSFDVLCKNDDNDSLVEACANGNIDIVKYLGNLGGNTYICNDEALKWACIRGHFDIVKYLVEEGYEKQEENNINVYKEVLKWPWKDEIIEYLTNKIREIDSHSH